MSTPAQAARVREPAPAETRFGPEGIDAPGEPEPSGASTAAPSGSRRRSKALATWVALLGGGFGLHRFYLHGLGDRCGWLFPLPTLLGAYGVLRMRALGADDQLAWVLIPLLGLTLAAAMLAAIVYGLTPDEAWRARFDPAGTSRSGWGTVIGVVVALAVGATIAMATVAFSAQRYFEYQAAQPVPGRNP